MPQLQVKKAVAVCFLESAKLTLEHVGAHRLALSQRAAPGNSDLPRLYGDLRRLRDYLQRSASSYQDLVTLDLTEEDIGLLVAACRREVEAIEYRLIGQGCGNDERRWLKKKIEVLAEWAVELAAKPLLELPLPPVSPTPGETTRALKVRLQERVYGPVDLGSRIVAPHTLKSSMHGIESFGDEVVQQQVATKAAPATTADEEDDEPLASPLLTQAGGQPKVLLDVAKIRDPRLRSLLNLDLATFQRVHANGDYRLSTILLASVLEAALLDHLVPRRGEFGLSGAPETWPMHELILKALGQAAKPKDRALAFHLFSSRNQLRPSLQIVSPTVITQSSFDSLLQFTKRALHALGFGAPAASEEASPAE